MTGTRSGWGLCFVATAVLLFLAMTAAGQAESSTKAATGKSKKRISRPPKKDRVVHLPGDGSIGYLSLGDGNPSSSDWEEIGPATGTIIVPGGRRLFLKVAEGTEDISILSRYKPTDLDLISLDDTAIQDQDLAHIAHMTRLRYVGLGDVVISDKGMSYLSRIKSLEVLTITKSTVTDAGLKMIGSLPKMAYLTLCSPAITGSTLPYLSGCKHMSVLALPNPAIDDRTLALLPDFPRIWALNLNNTKITDAGLAEMQCSNLHGFELANTRISGRTLGHFKNLGVVDLSGTDVDDQSLGILCNSHATLSQVLLERTRVTNAGMPSLLKHKNTLTYLYLRKTRVDDQALPVLRQFTKLRFLDLPASVSKKAAAQLRHSLPTCKVTRAHI